MSTFWIDRRWSNEDYTKAKQLSFDLIDSFLVEPPKIILDIGCGLAFESEMLQKKYGCELYLLDGDFEATKDNQRDKKYGDVNSMRFYSKVEDLKKSYDSRGMKYQFIDANNIEIDSSIKFDLVYSNVSCGYHYPLSTYRDLLAKHTNDQSLLLFDIHAKHLYEQLGEDFIIVEKKYGITNKIPKCRIRLSTYTRS